MKIGLDLDDTINNLADVFNKYALKFNQENNINYEIKENEWGFDKAFGWQEENVMDFFQKYLKRLLQEATIKEKAKEVINNLYEQGHEIFIITARSRRQVPDVIKISEEWLQQNDIKYHQLIIEGKDKADKCVEHNVEIFVDDRPNNCEQTFKKANIPVYIFDNQYNQGDDMLGIKRVYNWDELEKEIYQIINKK